MALEQALITWAHLVSASIWVGGSLFIAVVIAPLLKSMTSSVQERLQIMIKVGRKFNKIAIPSLAILIATGIFNAHQILLKPEFLLSTNYGMILLVKIILVVALIVSFAVHVVVIRRQVEEKIMQNQFTELHVAKLRKKIIILGQIVVALSVAVLFLAALLDAGL